MPDPPADETDRLRARLAREREARLEAEAIAENATREMYLKEIGEIARSNEDLDTFANVVSHNLREPLRMIASFLQLLERRYRGKIDAQADEYISFAVDGAKRLGELLHDIHNYTRVGQPGLVMEEVRMDEILASAVTDLQVAIREAGAHVTQDPLPTVRANASQILLVVQNLVSNGVKFRSKEPARIHVSCTDQPEEWVFSVADNGIGIAPAYHGKLFQLFERLHGREGYPGTGLGLAICKRIVERHGGRIWVVSDEGKGATFSFALPKHAHPKAGRTFKSPARP